MTVPGNKSRKVVTFFMFAALAFLVRDIWVAVENDVWISYQPYDILRSLDILKYEPKIDFIHWLIRQPMSLISLTIGLLFFVFGK